MGWVGFCRAFDLAGPHGFACSGNRAAPSICWINCSPTLGRTFSESSSPAGVAFTPVSPGRREPKSGER